MHIEEYESILKDARVSGSKIKIANRYPAHCKAAMKQLFQHALENQRSCFGENIEIRLFTLGLNDYFFDADVQNQLRNF